ncbi:helix-turn-helix domain-containing protein (plasmid) [Streptomyces sp. NBC_00637]|uniref:hypothetical protein n=1 Tax=Streptomyces sp. NBC_00637 TaxID=2903667 RepID=UPI00324EF633
MGTTTLPAPARTGPDWVRQRVKVPMRLVDSAHYSDAALSVYIKVKALAQRPEGCTAGIATLASYLGLSQSTVQRGLAQLRSPGPDGIVELPDSRRRSLPGGRGTTAQRRVRPMTSTERFIWVPVITSECLRPRLLRAYAVISYAVAQRHPLTVGLLADLLRHHSGRRAGLPIAAEAAGRVIDQLAASGWITVHRRAGERGRHLFLVHDGRTPPVPAPRELVPTTGLDDRSGTRVHEESLVYEEDLCTDRPENELRPSPPAVGEKPLVEAEGGASTPCPTSGSNGGGETPEPVPQATDRSAKPPYTGPPLTFSKRVHTVLEPVRFLLDGLKPYVLRLIGREVSRQLDRGTAIDRLRGRLTRRLAAVFLTDIRDVGRWLVGVALPRWGCADPDCERGMLWSTGAPCRTCQEAIADRRATAAARSLPTPVAAGGEPERQSPPARRRLPRATGDALPHADPGHSGSPQEAPSAPERVVISPCRGRAGACARMAPHGLCWRCRVEEVAPPPDEGGAPAYSSPTSAGSRTASGAFSAWDATATGASSCRP